MPQLVELGRKFFAYAPYAAAIEFDPEDMERGLLNVFEHGVALVADNDGEILGGLMAMAVPMWSQPSIRIAVELAWWVEEKHRNGLVGLKLLRAFEAWAEDNDLRFIAMSDLVLAGQKPVGDTLHRLGYQLMERSHVKVM